ncbi:Exodeoxyribonuclease 7 small subunit [Geodia barretti]|uniref:Exodeoxyribonuclease 7 small subunit n=1 Tax=Geodia barretti TaxID=519541 RepID=A0AA35R8G7_GEOBA|nr:Exodeoxyribonuclease 7 small subunit [Geodia barretti]
MSTDNTESLDPSAGADDPGFEDAFRQLAEIAERLEAGGLTLAEATARYEQGMKLVQRCNQLLDSAELEITTLRDNYQRAVLPATLSGAEEPPFFDEAPYDDVGDEEESLPF